MKFHGTLESQGRSRGIPHLAKNERDTPNFLHAALGKTARAAFCKESRMKIAQPTKLHGKSGIWGTQGSIVRTVSHAS